MNEKGFTLLEILATVAIIGIISLVATVSITKIIKDSKAKQLTIIKNTISSAVDNYRIYNLIAINENFSISNLSSSNTGDDYLDSIEYDNEKCLIDSNAGFIKIVNVEEWVLNDPVSYNVEKYCINFVCNGTTLINDAENIDYCSGE